jgi:hypothetical protein
VFVSTAVITLLALVGVLKLGGATRADHRYYLNRLFIALVLEVVASAVAVFYQETRTPQLSELPNQLVQIQARIDALEKRQGQTPSGRRWELVRVGSDCSGQDIAATTGTEEPDKANCQSPNVTAVCWDGNLFRNGTRPWCTYKSVEPDKCVGGGAPGRLYRCIP